jgi:Tol biopolymer transport system component
MHLHSALLRSIHACGLLALALPALSQSTTLRVSVASGGGQANGASGNARCTPDGRYVVFDSAAKNLVANDNNVRQDVFLHDTLLGTTVRVSVSSAGAEAHGNSVWPWISADGGKVFFTSDATDLVAGDTNTSLDVFAHDMASGATTRVSVTHLGAQAAGPSLVTGCSDDGRYVAFGSGAFNLVPGDTNGLNDVFVRDLQTGSVVRASVDSSGAQGSSWSQLPALSGDGRFVAFDSASSFVANDQNQLSDLYVHDLATGVTELVSVDVNGAAGSTFDWMPALSRDGRYVAFASEGSNLVVNDGNNVADVFVRDRVLGVTERCSVGVGGAAPNDASGEVAISASGRLVAFQSLASNLVAGDSNGAADIFVRDWVNDLTQRASIANGGGQANGPSTWPSIGAMGRPLAFASAASNLVAGDTNGFADVFVRLDAPLAPQAFCTAGTSSHGCVASISASAQPSVALAAPCTIHVSGVDGQRAGIVFYGIDNSAFAPLSWGPGSSFLCIKPPTLRTGVQLSGGTVNACDGALQLDWNAFQAANPGALGQVWSAGDTAYVQAWFRDPPSPKTTSLSNALELVYVP